jgi:hypothetical protein
MCARPTPDSAGLVPIPKRKRRRSGPDGRTQGARRLKALIVSYSADLGELNQVDKALVRTAAVLTLKLEIIENDLAAGKPVDADELIRLASTSRRALAAVSAKAVDRKPAAMTLADHLAKRAAALEVDNIDEDGDAGS